jgi:hypothetical protein
MPPDEIRRLDGKFETWVDFIVRNSPFKLERCWHDIWVLPWARPLSLQSKCKNYVFLKFPLLLSFGWQCSVNCTCTGIKTTHCKLRFPHQATPEMELLAINVTKDSSLLLHTTVFPVFLLAEFKRKNQTLFGF